MKIIRKPVKRTFNSIYKPTIRKSSRKVFSRRNFAKISQEMLDAIEDAIEDGMHGHYEPYSDFDEVRIQKDGDKIKLNTFLYIDASLALGGGIATDNVEEGNLIKEAETKSNNKKLEDVYSAENMAEWLNWDVIAEDYDIKPEKLKQLWIDNKLDYDENPELVEEIEGAFRDDEQANVIELEVILDTRKDTADIFLDIEDYYGLPWLHVYHSIIDLTGDTKADTQKICNSIKDACHCF